MGIRNWTEDPLVLIEAAVTPALSAPVDILNKAAIGQMPSAIQAELSSLQVAHDMLSVTAPDMMKAVNVIVDVDGRVDCERAIRALADMQQKLKKLDRRPLSDDDRAALFDDIVVNYRPAICTAVNVYRRVFITMVLTTQNRDAKISERSIKELERISKQIFFVAINATVEAARLGDQGAALGHIGKEIRALSKSAQVMIDQMRTAD